MDERKIDLSGLPRKGKLIDWKNSTGCKCRFVYDDIKGEVEIIDYDKENTTLNITFDKKEYKLKTGVFTKCQFGKMLDKFTSDFKIEMGTRFKDEKRDITIIDREYRKNKKGKILKYYKYKCNKCPNEDLIEESKLNKTGCNVCCAPSRKILKGYNDLATTHPNVTGYLLNKDDAYNNKAGSHKKVRIKCPDCGDVKSMTVYDLCRYGNSCDVCSDGISYPNKFMYNLLIKLNINFQNEYSPTWIGRKSYDFYDKTNNIIIEMDGRLGHGNKPVIGTLTSEESKEIDNWKDEQARLHGMEVIRINCNYAKLEERFEFIKRNIISSKLNRWYDFNKVSWIDIDENSCNSTLKKVCEFKNEHPEKMVGFLSNIFKISTSTVTSYLKIGDTLGWCKYDKAQYYKFISKKVEVFKDNKSLGVFESAKYIGRNSELLFNTKLNPSIIGKVCKKERIDYKGYVFRYANV